MIIVNSKYPSQTTTPSTEYPYGGARNVSTTGAGDGFPWEKDWANDTNGFYAALMVAAGLTPSNAPEAANNSQLLQALQTLFAPKANQIIGPTLLRHSGGISGSTTSTTPVLIANTLSGVSVQAGDILEIEFGPFAVSTSAPSDADLVVHLVEDYDASATPIVNEDYLMPSLGTDPKIVSWKFSYVATKTATLSFQLNQISNAGITFVVSSISNLGSWGSFRVIRP